MDYRFLDTLEAGCLIADHKSRKVLFANRVLCQISGLTLEQFYTRTWDSFIIDSMREATVASIQTQLKVQGTFHTQCYITTAQEDCWMEARGSCSRDESGQEQLCIVAIDNTAAKQTMLRLEEEKEFSRIIQKLSRDILFEVDLATNELSVFNNTAGQVIAWSRIGQFPWQPEDCYAILPEDVPRFLQMAKALRRGVKVTTEFRMQTNDAGAEWHRLEYDFLYDSARKPVRAVGRIVSIGHQKELEAQATRDPLTRLNNKAQTEALIEQCIDHSDPQKRGAFLIVDIDDFKGVNDNLGHHFGDQVLMEVSQKLQGLFRADDIVGRIGGDEFVVYLSSIRDEAIVLQKAKEIADAFRRTFSGEHREYKISGSIGVALYPQHGKSYAELYKNADSALYESKRLGKDCYTLYREDIAQCMISNPRFFEESKRYTSQYFSGNIICSVLDLLSETQDIHASVNKVLEIVGRSFRVDRCYIFETTLNGTVFNNTYEWCGENIAPEINNLQGLAKEELDYVLSRYNEEGIFYCNDLSVMDDEIFNLLDGQGIKSMLQCAILEKGVIKGVVGFDDCRKHRVWGGEEIAVLAYVTKILGIFLINKGISNELMQSYRNQAMLLDSMNGYVYVIDRLTHDYLFVNQTVRSVVPTAAIGQKCYQVAFGRDCICERCPAMLLDEETDCATLEIYNENFDLWTLATASKVPWIGSTAAALVCCTDITPYKKQAGAR